MVKRILKVVLVLLAISCTPCGGLLSAVGLGGADVHAAATEDFETGNIMNLPWVTGGWDYLLNTPLNASWSVTDQNIYTGSYAVKAPAITDSQSSCLEITMDVVEPGTISFWYKVSSEDGWDFLNFYIDGVLQYIPSSSFWSGEIDWTLASYPVSLVGVHTFKWEYRKDDSDGSDIGLDTAWLDDIVLPGTPVVPTYPISSPGVGINGTITCDTPVALGGNSDCTITTADGYRLATLLDNGVDKWSPLLGNIYTISNVREPHDITGTFVSRSDYEDFETGDLTKFPWSTNGPDNAKWSVTTAVGHAGGDTSVAKAPALGNDQASDLTTTLYVPADGNITFWYKVSSEVDGFGGGDFLTFYIDGEPIIIPGDPPIPSSWGGEIDWTQASYPVSAGVHTFKWEYAKDGADFAGSDTAWIDDIVILGVSGGPYTISTQAGFGGSISCNKLSVPYGTESVCTITTAPNYNLATFTDNSVDKLPSLLNGSYTVSNVIRDHTIAATFISNSDIEDFETGDLTKFPWASAGWSVTGTDKNTGNYAAGAPLSLSVPGTSFLRTTLNIPVNSNITFWYRVASEPDQGFLRFYINGNEQLNETLDYGWSGDIAWTSISFPVDAGPNLFSWEYSRESASTSGTDTAWIDDIVFTGASPPVKLMRGATTVVYKAALQDVYDLAASDDVIMLKAGKLAGGLTADKEKLVTIKGGYADDFLTNDDMTTVGPITLKAGTVRVEHMSTAQ